MSAIYADPRLSRFDPLERIFFYDDFDEGIRGWSELIGNYEHSLDSMLPEYSDMRPPMLSNLSMWDTGTAGSMEGTYALKLASRARTGSLATSIKRQTFRRRGQIQLECYFTFKPEASELRLSLDDVRAFGVLFDLQDGMNPEYRWMPHLRYLNAHGRPYVQSLADERRDKGLPQNRRFRGDGLAFSLGTGELGGYRRPGSDARLQ